MKVLILLIISISAHASISEFFGASTHNVMVGNQIEIELRPFNFAQITQS